MIYIIPIRVNKVYSQKLGKDVIAWNVAGNVLFDTLTIITF